LKDALVAASGFFGDAIQIGPVLELGFFNPSEGVSRQHNYYRLVLYEAVALAEEHRVVAFLTGQFFLHEN
jgi:hypothetical protein